MHLELSTKYQKDLSFDTAQPLEFLPLKLLAPSFVHSLLLLACVPSLFSHHVSSNASFAPHA